jgi:CBS domain-containing protein
MRVNTEPGLGGEVGAADGAVEEVDLISIGDEQAGSFRGNRHKIYPPPPPSVRHKRGTTDWQQLEMKADPIFARDLMTRNLLTIGPEDVLVHLEEQMQAFRFRHLPVVENDRLVGLISHADLLRASSTFLSDKSRERDALIHQLPASRIMQRDLLTVRPSATLMEVAALMWSTRVGCVPVTEQNDRLVGIITEADFIRVAHHFLAPLSPRELGTSGDH